MLPGDSSPAGQSVQNAFGSVFNADGDEFPGIAVVGLNQRQQRTPGQYALYNNSTSSPGLFQNMPKVSANSPALLLGRTGLDSLRSQQAAKFTGEVTLLVHAWDGLTGTEGTTINLNNSKSIGGKTAFSSAVLTAKLYFNHAPTQNATASTITLTATAENVTSKMVTVSSLLQRIRRRPTWTKARRSAWQSPCRRSGNSGNTNFP